MEGREGLVARIRTVKPAFFRSLTITSLAVTTRMTFIGLWTYADDEGRGVDDARLVKSELWPLDDKQTVKRVESDLVALAKAGLIRRYESGTRNYFVISSWHEHQKISKPQDSSFPCPPPFRERSGNDPGTDQELSSQEGKGREGKQEGNRRAATSVTALALPDSARPRNHLFDALAHEWGCKTDGDQKWILTKAEGQKIRAAASQLSEIGAEPDEVPRKADAYRRKHPSWEFTPNALVSHWSALDHEQADFLDQVTDDLKALGR